MSTRPLPGGADRLRFDFTHFSALTAEELAQVSAMVNEAVLEGYDVVTEELPIEQAKKKGAIALFGEKYGDVVRVVDMGEGYSVEFCGGTHLSNTAKVGLFHIAASSPWPPGCAGLSHHRQTLPGGDEPEPGASLPGR